MRVITPSSEAGANDDDRTAILTYRSAGNSALPLRERLGRTAGGPDLQGNFCSQMSEGIADWPTTLDPATICLTVDVEWAADAVVVDLCRLFDERGLRATFFVTHDGVTVPGHERGLHPNFRRNGESYRSLRQKSGSDLDGLGDERIYAEILAMTRKFAPEAKGLRSHSLHYDSALFGHYREAGLEYDCTYLMPMVGGLRPFWKERDIVAIPTYYADHFDLMSGVSHFELGRLGLDRPGLKVFDFHPNMVFLNASSEVQYEATKSFYRDPDRLLAARGQGRGIRSLLLDLLDEIVRRQLPTATVNEVNEQWRTTRKWV
jgi:hypothetical protein